MISSASHDSVSRLVADRSMCLATALDKAFENIDCMIAIPCCQAKNRFYESTQRLIQPRRVLWSGLINFIQTHLITRRTMQSGRVKDNSRLNARRLRCPSSINVTNRVTFIYPKSVG